MKELAKALIKARKSMGKLVKDAKNPHFKTKYATLSNVIETGREHFAEYGIDVKERYELNPNGGGPILCLTLFHEESGDFDESKVELLAKDMTNPQQIKSASTYMRRMVWEAATGLAPEDDDGNAAAQAPQKPAQAKAKPAATVDQTTAKNKLKAAKGALITKLTALGYDEKETQIAWITANCEHYGESKTLNLDDVHALAIAAKIEGEKAGDFPKK